MFESRNLLRHEIAVGADRMYEKERQLENKIREEKPQQENCERGVEDNERCVLPLQSSCPDELNF